MLTYYCLDEKCAEKRGKDEKFSKVTRPERL